MNLKSLYLKSEEFLAGKPIATAILFALIGLILSVIPLQFFSSMQVTGHYSIAWYYVYVALALQFFTSTICFIYFKQKTFRKRMIKLIESLLHKLNSPFSRSSETLLGKQIIEERYYDYSMIQCFEDHNRILVQIKSKYTTEFSDLKPLPNNKRIHPGDWIPESELNGVKLSLIELKRRLS
jgi:hypothetical protein